MAGLAETEEFPEEVYLIETTDPVVGGAPNEGTGAGMSNIPHLQLAKRTRWLKAQVDALVDAVVDASVTVKGIVQLSAATNSTSTTTAATPSAVKAANDNANTRALKATTVTGGGLATGGGDLSANRTITVPIASQAEAEAGTANDKAMTPLSTAQAIAVAVGGVNGAVGTYAFAYKSDGTSSVWGETYAGANLRAGGVGNSSGAADVYSSAAALSGTWLCMGNTAGGGDTIETTLWKRIA